MDKLELEAWIEKILGYKTWTDKKKIDSLLEYDCSMYTRLGLDSTKTERTEVKRKSKLIYRAIGRVNESMGKKFLYYMD